MGKSILFISGKGGVGKSTAAVSFALALEKLQKKVILMDADIGLRCMDLMLNMQDVLMYDLSDVLNGNCPLDEALYPVPGHEHILFLGAAQFLRAAEVKPKEITQITRQLKLQCDFLLIDCPAGLGRNVKICLPSADEAVLIATPDDVSVRSAQKAASILQTENSICGHLLFNRTDQKMIRRGQMVSPFAAAEKIGFSLLGMIPESYAVYRALLRHQSAYECGDKKVKNAYDAAAQCLVGIAEAPKEERSNPVYRFFLHSQSEE